MAAVKKKLLGLFLVVGASAAASLNAHLHVPFGTLREKIPTVIAAAPAACPGMIAAADKLMAGPHGHKHTKPNRENMERLISTRARGESLYAEPTHNSPE